MSEPIIVTFEETGLTKSGHRYYSTIEGKKYYVNKDKNIPITLHTPAKLLCSIQDIGGKKLHWINWAGMADPADKHTPRPMTAPQVPKTEQNSGSLPSKPAVASKYTEADLKAFKAKDIAIKRMSALNNAANMVLACSNAINHEKHFKELTLQEVIAYFESLEKKFYNEHLKMLNDPVGYKTSPSGIEVAEEVTSEEYNSGEVMD